MACSAFRHGREDGLPFEIIIARREKVLMRVASSDLSIARMATGLSTIARLRRGAWVAGIIAALS